MARSIFNDDYFEWLSSIVCRGRYEGRASFKKLLRRLHDIDFYYIIPKDANRAADGIEFRLRYADSRFIDDRPNCSVLEMLVALAVRCEETIMDDPRYGDRTGQWFWRMIVNLGLGGVTDSNYDEQLVDETIDRFLKREYSPDGHGGLFVLRNCRWDLREVEIWHQLLWYLDTII